MLLKVTALRYVTILDPYPLEGVGEVTIQQVPGEYKEYDILPEQVHRLIPLLDDARNAGLLTYEVEGDGLDAIAIEDEGVSIELHCRTLNFVGSDVQAVSSGPNKVDVLHDLPPYSPFLGSGSGALEWPATTPGYIDRPEGGEGNPYFAKGWDDKTNGHPRLNTTSVNTFSNANGGLGITHTSARVTDLHLGQIDVILTDGQGNTETVSLVLNPAGGDQDAISAGGNLAIHIRNTVFVGTIVEGEVYIWSDPPSMLAAASGGPGGYFKLEVNHTVAPTDANFGEAFWDDGVIPNGSANPTVTPNTPVVRYLSGIRYFNTGSTFNVVDDSPTLSGVKDVVNMTMNNDGVIFNIDASEFNVIIGDVVFSSASILNLNYGPLQSPLRTDRPKYNQTITVGAGGFGDLDARVHTTWENFHGDEAGSPKTSAAGIYQIWTYVTSTETTEYYEDEAYRLRSEVVNNFKQNLTDMRSWYGGGAGADLRNWDSQQSINTGSAGHQSGLQFYGGYLVYPTIDFSTGYYFVDFDYSVCSGDRFAFRAFNVGDLLNHKAFTITLQVDGLDTSDFNIGLGGDDSTDARVDILFPGPERPTPNGSNDNTYPGSGWLHCGKLYNAPSFTGINNDGVLQSMNLVGSTLTIYIVTGNMSSYYTEGTVILRIRYKSSISGKIGQTTVVGT